ncbi:sensor histidine kinase [Actinomadura kijaniata]|uniref:sensor histidine kinase n=1 Tax=Actinomadura kijaniata TaxID=46161 RepID=UPI000B1AEDA9|nr:ATP-binding protein [Actinomadura kijaniata]
MRITARARLTALYGGLILLAGGGLIALVHVLMRRALAPSLSQAITVTVSRETARAVPARPAEYLPHQQDEAVRLADAAERTTLDQLLTVSLVALAVFALLSIALAWWMAGRVLRPVHTITATARRLSGETLHERIALAAPPGELKDLADTFDAMLDRISALVASQQRFVANAAHELRTPLAVQRAALEIGLSDPTPERVAEVRTRLLTVADRSERLIEGLLLLSASDQGLDRTEPVDLAQVIVQAAAEQAPERESRSLRLDTRLEPFVLQGDPALLSHLVRNLLENATRYNVPDGRIAVHLDESGLTVTNTGPRIPPETVPHLFEPFRRLNPRRHTRGEGTGLGLSIVTSIAKAHKAQATATPNPDGGLTVRVTFTRAAERVSC